MTVKFTKFDPVDYLDSPERIDDYLIEAEKEGDSVFFAKAKETAKRARKKLHNEDRKSLEMKFARTSIRSIQGGLVTMYPSECYGVA